MKRKKNTKMVWNVFCGNACIYIFVKSGRFCQCGKGTGVSASESDYQSHSIRNRKNRGNKGDGCFCPGRSEDRSGLCKPGEAVKKEQPMMTFTGSSIQESIDKKTGRDPGDFSLKISDIQSQKDINDQKQTKFNPQGPAGSRYRSGQRKHQYFQCPE